MPKLYPFILLLFFSQFTQAQVKEGTILITPSIGYVDNRHQLNDQKGGAFGVGLSVGRAIGYNLVAGIGGNYSRQELSLNGQKQKERTYSVHLFADRFFFLSQRFALTGNSMLRYSNTTSRNNDPGNTTNRAQEVALAVGPGLSYKVTDGLMLRAGFSDLFRLAYRNEGYPANPAAPTNHTLYLGFNAAPESGAFFGLSFLLGQ